MLTFLYFNKLHLHITNVFPVVVLKYRDRQHRDEHDETTVIFDPDRIVITCLTYLNMSGYVHRFNQLRGLQYSSLGLTNFPLSVTWISSL